MTITFTVSDKQPSPVRTETVEGNFLESLQEYKQDCISLLQGTAVNPAHFRPRRNGFVDTVVQCYNEHHNLVIRPDDVWLAIMAQFAFFVNGNAEQLRHMFVEHKGKQQVEVKTVGSLHSVDYGLLSKLMAAKLRQRLQKASDPHVADWILPSFSTTTDADVIAGSVLLMGTVKSYFSYKFCLMCGIPQVTLEGSTKDWQDIRSRVDKLPIYGGSCVKWASMLTTVADEFVAASAGQPNNEFWSKICHYHGGGSGPRYLSGWITSFCVFNQKGEWQGDQTSVKTYMGQVIEDLPYPVVDSADTPPGYVTVDVLVDDNGVEHDTMMFGGHMGNQLIDEHTLAPKLMWAICLKKPGGNSA